MKIFHFYLDLLLILKPELFDFLLRNPVSGIKKPLTRIESGADKAKEIFFSLLRILLQSAQKSSPSLDRYLDKAHALDWLCVGFL